MSEDYIDSPDDVSFKTKPYSFLYDLDLDQDVINKLSLHLSGLSLGNSDVFVTPLGSSYSPDSILEKWNSIFDSKISLINDNLYNLEMSNKSKFGPRSLALPWLDRVGSVEAYFKGRPDFVSHADINHTNIQTSGSLRPISVSKAAEYLKPNTSSGLPYLSKKKKVKARVVDEFTNILDRRDPCVLFTRTQESGKTRNVWGYPIADTLNEMRFYQPLLSYQRSLSWRSALRGPEEVDKSMTKLINQAIVSGYSIVSVDFPSFDTLLSNELQAKSFSYVKSLFQNSYHSEIDYIHQRFNTIGLVTPSGVFRGSHGVPSGSTFTNEIDSIGQYIACTSFSAINPDLIDIQGDDGVYILPEPKVEPLFLHLERQGLPPSKEKSAVSRNHCVYLQNLFDSDYRLPSGTIGGIYPTYRAINRLLFQERWSDFEDFGLSGSDYYSLRAITILENCKHHPLFYDLVRFIYDLDKYSLDYSKTSLRKFINKSLTSSGTGGILFNQYGDDFRGINRFKTVEILRGFA